MLNHTDIRITPREREILELLVNQSLPNKEIGEELGMNEMTVKRHLQNLYTRAGIGQGRKRVVLAAMFRPAQEPQPNRAHFTRKEWVIACMVADGCRNDVIAETVETTVNTVKNYLRTIFNKAGVWSRLELAAWVDAHRKDSMAEAHGQ